MPEFVYVLCVVTSVMCAGLLVRTYRQSRSRMLLWSAACFVGFAINSLLLLVDLVFVPSIDLRLVRSASAGVALLLLLVGLIWEQR